MMLAGLKDPRSFLGANALSYSEFSTLAACEKRWALRYNDHVEEDDTSEAMELGSEMHRLLSIWWGQGSPLGWDKTEHPTAAWLMQRYNEHYMGEGAPLQMLATEIPFAVDWYGVPVFGWFDGLVKNHETGDLWITEFKTMGNWSKLHQLPVDKQVTLYIWAARKMGLDVKGVMYDAIRTYRWTGKGKDDHPPAESFQRLWVTRTDEQIEEFLAEMGSFVNRRWTLLAGEHVPIRNVGQACSYCSVMPDCFGLSLTLTDDDVTLSI